MLNLFFDTIEYSFVTQELRKKNWKAMEAVNDAEKNAQAQINKALEAAKVPRPSAKHLLTILTTSS